MKKQFLTSNYEVSQDANIILSGISVIGERNKKDENHNQDSYKIKLLESSALISVADGLGSCKNSNIGSKYAVECIAQWVETDLPKYQKISNEMLVILNNKLIDRWRFKLAEFDYQTYDTTLLYAIYIDNNLIVGGIGDGMILCFYDGKTYDLSWRKNEFSNRTVSMGTRNAKDLIRSEIIPICDGTFPVTVLLMTDGISDDLNENRKEELPKYLNSRLNEVGVNMVQNELCDWIFNWKTQGHTDDRTLCMMNINKKF